MTVVKAHDQVILRYESTDGGRLKGGADVGGLFGDAQPHHTFMKVSFGTGGLRCEKCTADEMINSVIRKDNSPTFEFKGGRDELVIAAATDPKSDQDGIVDCPARTNVFVADNAQQLFKEMLAEGTRVLDLLNLDILTLKTRKVEHEQTIKAVKKWIEERK
jgi:hypothetical protein